MNKVGYFGILVIITVFIFMVTDAKSEEQNWFQKQWSETVEYQKQGWQDGKDQLARNKQQLLTIWEKVKGVTQNQ